MWRSGDRFFHLNNASPHSPIKNRCKMEVLLIILGLIMASPGLVPVVDSLDIDQGVIVHLFEWTYSDIARECEEFLAPQGFKGVQISPPSENLKITGRPWYERYQPVSYKLTTRSGSREDMADMLKRCNKVGVSVFADVVFNHMTASADKCEGTGGSTCNASAMSYPAVPYSQDHFHRPRCSIQNYQDTHEVRSCELVGLHDLDQAQEHVRQRVVDCLNQLIDLGIAGFRVDAAKHMLPADLAVIYSRLHNLKTESGFPSNTKPYIYQEVISDAEGVNYREYTSLGLVTDFKYGRELGRCFQGRNKLKWLKTFGSAWSLIPGNQSIVFIENHDTERGGNLDILNYKTSRAYKMAIAFMLAWPHGSPKILSSYKFSSFKEGPPHDFNYQILTQRPISNNLCSHGWVCQHRWRQIYNMITFHNVVKGEEVKFWWDNDNNQIAFCRGNKGFIAFNLENVPLNQKLQTCLPKGSYCDVISGDYIDGRCTGKSISVADDGTAQISISKFDQNSLDDGVLATHIMARLY